MKSYNYVTDPKAVVAGRTRRSRRARDSFSTRLARRARDSIATWWACRPPTSFDTRRTRSAARDTTRWASRTSSTRWTTGARWTSSTWWTRGSLNMWWDSDSATGWSRKTRLMPKAEGINQLLSLLLDCWLACREGTGRWTQVKPPLEEIRTKCMSCI